MHEAQEGKQKKYKTLKHKRENENAQNLVNSKMRNYLYVVGKKGLGEKKMVYYKKIHVSCRV